MSVIVLDAGNSIIKAKIARRERGEVSFPHALRKLTETEYSRIISRSGVSDPPLDYIRINGQPYVVGESAERHGIINQRNGAARYTRDYYGILAAATLGRLYDRSREVAVFGSHPPGDVNFRQDLMEAVIGDWDVEVKGKERHFRVSYANTFDEPVGGLMNVLLTEDGQHYQHANLNEGRALVIDIGGYTTDWLAVKPGGEVDYSLARSVPIGIQSVISDFEDSFRANNLEAVKNTPVLPPDRVRRAIASGVFEGGGRKYACEREVEEATSVMLNRIGNTYQQIAGGALGWDCIILTGGGSGLLYKRMLSILKAEEAAQRGGTSRSKHRKNGLFREKLLALEPEERQNQVENFLKEQIAKVLKFSPSKIDVHQPLDKLGIDSLMGFELINRLETELEVAIPMAVLLQGPSISQLTTQLLGQLAPPSVTPDPTPTNDIIAEDELLAQVDKLSDEEVDAMLREMVQEEDADAEPIAGEPAE